jgi:membrane-associated phospholipid phosphatase
MLLLAVTAPLAAQQERPHPAAIQWWQGVALVGGIALLSAWDESVRTSTQQHRSHSGDQVAAVARRMGQPEVFATVPGAIVLAGFVGHRPALRRAGERVVASLAVAGVLAVAGKEAVGRLRPDQADEQYDFKPFSGAAAFPSGHATMAFALATSLANEIHRPWATVGLMTAAAGTGWSRINDNEHWLSDVVAGAAVGIASAQFVGGRWTVFHLQPPVFFTSPGRSGLRWQIPIRVP